MKPIECQLSSCIIAVLFLCTIGCDKVFDPLTEASENNDARYFRFTPGSQWTYAIEGGGNSTYSVLPNGSISSDGSIIPAGEYDLKNGEFWVTLEWLCNPCGASGNWVPFLMVPKSMKYWEIDASKKASWSYYVSTGSVSGRLGSEKVSVTAPAGTFDDCALCVVTSSIDGTSRYYIAPKVGIVKCTTPEHTYLLSSYSITE